MILLIMVIWGIMVQKDIYCKYNKCLFIMNDNEQDISITIQTNMEILEYIKNNYNGIYHSNLFSVYIN